MPVPKIKKQKVLLPKRKFQKFKSNTKTSEKKIARQLSMKKRRDGVKTRTKRKRKPCEKKAENSPKKFIRSQTDELCITRSHLHNQKLKPIISKGISLFEKKYLKARSKPTKVGSVWGKSLSSLNVVNPPVLTRSMKRVHDTWKTMKRLPWDFQLNTYKSSHNRLNVSNHQQTIFSTIIPRERREQILKSVSQSRLKAYGLYNEILDNTPLCGTEKANSGSLWNTESTMSMQMSYNALSESGSNKNISLNNNNLKGIETNTLPVVLPIKDLSPKLVTNAAVQCEIEHLIVQMTSNEKCKADASIQTCVPEGQIPLDFFKNEAEDHKFDIIKLVLDSNQKASSNFSSDDNEEMLEDLTNAECKIKFSSLQDNTPLEIEGEIKKSCTQSFPVNSKYDSTESVTSNITGSDYYQTASTSSISKAYEVNQQHSTSTSDTETGSWLNKSFMGQNDFHNAFKYPSFSNNANSSSMQSHNLRSQDRTSTFDYKNVVMKTEPRICRDCTCCKNYNVPVITSSGKPEQKHLSIFNNNEANINPQHTNTAYKAMFVNKHPRFRYNADQYVSQTHFQRYNPPAFENQKKIFKFPGRRLGCPKSTFLDTLGEFPNVQHNLVFRFKKRVSDFVEDKTIRFNKITKQAYEQLRMFIMSKEAKDMLID